MDKALAFGSVVSGSNHEAGTKQFLIVVRGWKCVFVTHTFSISFMIWSIIHRSHRVVVRNHSPKIVGPQAALSLWVGRQPNNLFLEK